MADERYHEERRPAEHQLPWPEHSEFGGEKLLPKPGDEAGAEQRSRKPLYVFLLAFAVLVVIVMLAGLLPRTFRDRENERRAAAERDAKPVVETSVVQTAKSEAGLVVPGTTIPLTEAYVYARANGYLKKRYVDIGDRVTKGQLLATIDAPDLDAQVLQAREQVQQAEQQLAQQKAQLALATVTVQRYRVLVTKGVLSRQEGDQQETNYTSQVANVEAAQRNVDAYKANLAHEVSLQSYEQVRAPFSGVITERDVDEGALISAAGATTGGLSAAPMGQTSSAGGTTQAGQTNSAGASGSSSTAATSAQSPGQGGPLFGVAQVQRLRILVSVPEGYATAIHVGQRAPVAVQEYQGAPLYAEVTRTAQSIDPNTRTMLTELQIDNAQGKLIAGMYAVVTFPPAAGVEPPLLISGDAVAVRQNESEVATVVNGRIHFVPVTLGRDFGNQVEIMTGLKPGDVIVTDVTDNVVENAEVKEHRAPPQPQRPPPQSTPPGGSTQYSNEGLTNQEMQGQQTQQNQKSQGQKPNQSHQNRSESKP